MEEIKPIDSIQYIEHFQKNFESIYFDKLANPRIQKITSQTIDELFCCPHLLLYGNDVSLLKLYSDTMLSRIFKKTIVKSDASYEVSSNNNKYNCPYIYSDIHVEIDVEQILHAEKQFICNFISNHIATTKNISQAKHVCVIHNIHKLNEQSIFSLRYPIERFSNNIYFIFTARTITQVEPAFLSRCLLIRSNVEDECIESFFETFLEQNDIDNEVEIDPNDGIVMNLLKLHGNNFQSSVEKQLHQFIDQLINEKDIFKVCENIRTFGFKILHFNIPIATIMKITLKYILPMKTFKKHIYKIVKCSADLEVKSAHMSKQILVFERYFVEIFKFAKMK